MSVDADIVDEKFNADSWCHIDSTVLEQAYDVVGVEKYASWDKVISAYEERRDKYLENYKLLNNQGDQKVIHYLKML